MEHAKKNILENLVIALGKMFLFSPNQSIDIFLISPQKHVVGTY